MRRTIALVGCLSLYVAVAPPLRANEEVEAEVQSSVTRGLEWLAHQQHADGHWEGNGGAYPTAMTGLSGMALLMQGSTICDGKYAERIRKAVEWFCRRAQSNGLIGNSKDEQERIRYMYGHGYGMLFLSQVYGDEPDGELRARLQSILTKAVLFSCKAQTKHGGWGYISAADSKDWDEGSTTAAQLQGLRAARNAGIVVPKEAIDKAVKYLEACTEPDDGLRYRYEMPPQGRRGLPAITAAGICCGFSAGQYDSVYPKRWIKFCQKRVTVGGTRMGHDEYLHYHYAQAMYCLGEDRYQRMFKDAKDSDVLTWSKYRNKMYPHLIEHQQGNGSWNATGPLTSQVGAVYATAVSLTILQLDRGTLPIYQR